MGLKKGDIIDEFKRFPDGCGLVVKVMHGGEGFQKIVCCGHELTAEDVVPARLNRFGRKISPKGVGYIIDEKKSHPSACGLRLTVVDGGHTLTLADEKELLTLGFGNLREAKPEEEPDQSPGPAGTA